MVYIYSELPTYVRVEKNLRLFNDIYDDVTYIGCNRSGGKWKKPLPNIKYNIYEEKIAHGGIKSVKNSIGFLFYVMKKLNNIKPDVIIFCNEEYYLPFLFPFISRPKFLVCEVLDSLAIRVVGPMSNFSPIFSLYCRYVRKKVDLVVEMTEERLSFYDEENINSVVIHNSPMIRSNDLELSDSINIKLPKSPYIFVSGSILQGISGIETLLDATSRIKDVVIVFAGRKSGSWVDEVISHPKVNYLGVLAPEDALLVARKSLAIFAHYKPVNRNYIFAAPNKLYDSLSIGKPIVINSECKASDIAISAGNAFVSDYGDVSMLEARLIQIVNLTEYEKSEISNHSLSTFTEKYSWEVMKKRWVIALRFNK
jgi:glycosyltransferase involved in cell wall biosynthesis